MGYYHGSAATFDDVMEAVENFASDNGWTIDSRPANGLACHKRDVYISMTHRSDVRNAYITGNFDDYLLSMKIRRDVLGDNVGYSQETRTNDMAGPFSNVWLFSPENGDAINCVVQTAADRFSHFSFGFLDPRGMHEEDIGYVVGNFWYWWRDRANYVNDNGPFNNPGDPNHSIGYFGERTDCHHAIPDDLLDDTLNFASGGRITDSVTAQPNPYVWRICDRRYRYSQGNDQSHNHFLDFFMAVDNQAQTGGIPLHAMPVVVVGHDALAKAYLGEYPDVRLCNISGLAVAQTVTFADEDWVVFPLKQYGTEASAYSSTSPQPFCNSGAYGLAYRKVV